MKTKIIRYCKKCGAELKNIEIKLAWFGIKCKKCKERIYY